ncbi:MAG: hypothetical protein V4592_04600 [Bacteroidota bacterium]
MKLLKILLIILLINAKASAQTHFVALTDSIHISGKVIGYKPGDEDNFIKFTTCNLGGDTKKQAFQLKADGTYDVKLYQAFAGDIQLNYKDAFVNIFVEPGKLLKLDIIGDRLLRGTGNRDAFVPQGDLAQVNQLMLNFQTGFDQHKFAATSSIGDNKQPDSAFAAKRMAQLNEELAFLDAFIKQSHVESKAFINWQRNQLTYTAAKEMVFFPFFGKLNKTITERQLLGFIKQIPISNNVALANSAYYSFLNSLSSSEQIIININTTYDAIRKQNGYSGMPLYLNKVDSVATGIAKQLMYYDMYRPQYNASRFTQVADRYHTVLQDAYIKELFDRRTRAATDGFARYSITDRLKTLNVSDDLKKRLLDLFDKEKGNNLYIDFWGDWCGPCMMEMPNYPNLITAFDGKPLKFIFMAAYTTPQNMLEIQNKYHIQAEFVNLTKDEVAIMNNVFDFHSYPSHFLVDRWGAVISNSLSGISSEAGLASVTKGINNLLQLK